MMKRLNDYLDVEECLDVVLVGNAVSGYYRGAMSQVIPVRVALLFRGECIGTAVCDGHSAFTIPLQLETRPTGERLTLIVVPPDLNAGHEVSTRNDEVLSWSRSSSPAVPIVAHLDTLLDNGLVEGWSWCPEKPDYKVSLIFVVDGSPVGTTVADLGRQDLASAGIGDGAHAFSYLLPWSVLHNKAEVTVVVAAMDAPHITIASRTFRRKLATTIEDRLNFLDQEVRLLRSRLKTVEDQNRHVTRWVSQVLGNMAAVFDQMSRLTLDVDASHDGAGFPTASRRSLSDFDPITLAPGSDVDFTLIIRADGDLEQIYTCLRNLAVGGNAGRTDIIVLDVGNSNNVSDIVVVAPGIMYWRVQSGQSEVEAVNLILQFVRQRFVGVFSSATQFLAPWIDDCISAFERDPTCMVIAPKLMRTDGTIEASAFQLDTTNRLVAFGHAHLEFDPKVDTPAAVVSACSHAMIFRVSSVKQVGLFSQSFVSLAPATVDLCIRGWAEGFVALYQPAIRFGWDESECPASPSGREIEPDLRELFIRTWERTPRQAWPNQV